MIDETCSQSKFITDILCRVVLRDVATIAYPTECDVPTQYSDVMQPADSKSLELRALSYFVPYHFLRCKDQETSSMLKFALIVSSWFLTWLTL
jgi:hypothetical protein